MVHYAISIFVAGTRWSVFADPVTYIDPSIHLSNRKVISQSILSSVHPSIYSFIHPSIHSFIHQFVHPSIHPSMQSNQPMHLSIYPSIHPSIHPTTNFFLPYPPFFSISTCPFNLIFFCIYSLIPFFFNPCKNPSIY